MLTFDKYKGHSRNITLLRTLKMIAHYSLYGLFLQAFFLNLLFASPVGGQDLRDVKISLSAQNVSLENALQKIEESTHFNFIYNKDEVPLSETVSIDVRDESLYNVLCSIAGQQGLAFQRINRQIVLKKSKIERSQPPIQKSKGLVKGKVTDAVTGEPLIGANIMVKGTKIGATTDIFGDYRIDNLNADTCTLVFQYVGYLNKIRTVNVIADRAIELNIMLEQGAYNLNEITVTGSISERTIRESANPITIITPRELENRNLNSLGEVLQTVPGVVSSKSMDTYKTSGRINDQSLSDLNIRGYSPSSSVMGSTKFIIDGVEVYDYRALSYIDPNQIEKIEVTRGPMSSTLYGAGSTGGIVQVFTKKGAGRLKINLKSMFTSKESDYQDSNPLISEYSLGLMGGMPDFSYSFSFDYQRYPISRFKYNNGTPEQDWVASGRVTGTLSNLKVDLNVQYSESETGSFLNNMWYKVGVTEGWENAESLLSTSVTDSHNENNGLMMSLNLRQPITNNIYHNLTLGISHLSSSTDINTPTVVSKGTYYFASEFDYKKTSAKYFVNMNKYIVPKFKVDLTGGAEYVLHERESVSLGFETPYDDNGSQSYSTAYNSSRSFTTNATTGVFAEAVWGYKEKLFLTTGFRAEKNSSYGDNTGWYKTPRIGLTYIISAGEFTFKPRASWGKSTQAIPELYKLGRTVTSGSYTVIYLPNPDLEPQTQQGYELGTDIFFTDNYSFGITYYNQTVSNLIQKVDYPSDDINTSISKYENVSEVYNHGVELNAKAVFNDFTINTSGTIVSSKYGDGFESSASYVYEGGNVFGIPSETLFLGVSYRIPSFVKWSSKGGNISLNYTWRGSAISTDYYSYYKTRAETGSSTSLTYKEFDGYYTVNSRADYSLRDNLSVFIDIINLLNNQDIVGGYPRSGRKISFGFNCTL